MPPCCCPATISGLMMRAAVVDRDRGAAARRVRCRRRSRRPRRASRTGTTTRRPGSRARAASRSATPSGPLRRDPSPRPRDRPTTAGSRDARDLERRRRRATMSSGLASSRCAASCFACASTSWLATEQRAAADLPRARTAGAAAARHLGGVGVQRRGRRPTARRACRRRSCENAVSWPWPCALVPTVRGDRAVVFDLDRAELLVEHHRRADLEVRRRRRCRAACLSPRSRRAFCSARNAS